MHRRGNRCVIPGVSGTVSLQNAFADDCCDKFRLIAHRASSRVAQPYGSAATPSTNRDVRAWTAAKPGLSEGIKLLEETLEWEKAMDLKLTGFAAKAGKHPGEQCLTPGT
jgi:hypothetical protein